MAFITKVITLAANGDKSQYFHHHRALDDIRINVNNDRVLEIAIEGTHPGDKRVKYARYPLCNVERFETEDRN